MSQINRCDNTNIITNSKNSTYKELLEISKGKVNNLLLCEGEDLLFEANKKGLLKKIIYFSKEEEILNLYKDIEQIHLSKELYKTLSNYSSLPRAIGVAMLNLEKEDFGNKVLYLDNLQDPGNVGTLIRSALAFSYDSVILSKDSVSLFSKKVIQGSKGAIFNIKLGIEDLTKFKDTNYTIYSTTLDGEDEKNFTTLDKPFILVLGNEGHGVRKEYKDISKKLKIQINNIDSLNVAIAGSIFMYRFNK